ncbi:MAG: leucine-rich repeat domain-containing protein [Planctomycetota bacterium]|jgi:hypothetical protein
MSDAPPDAGKRKSTRRRFQFRLRTLLILMAVFAVWLGLTADRARRQKRAVEAISEMGGEFCYDYQAQPQADGPGKSYSYRVEPPGPRWLRQLLGDHYFITAVRLLVRDQRVIDEGRLEYLDDLPDLEQLMFYNVELRDRDLAHLKHLPNLRLLLFGRGTLSGDDGPRQFDFLESCPRLEVLSARNSHFGDRGAAHLRHATNLELLFIYETPIGDDGLARLKHLTELKMLGLARTGVTDAGLAHLRSLGKLTYVSLSRTDVTDAGLEYLKDVKSLTEIELRGTRVTKEGVDKLRSALPGCEIDW